ncbi:NADP-dependent oxidoreductase [Streptomyces sp. AJS327]|uniref:NADP-dependent oxidoreductase n=1 Tax=Streptomyces sp. AJS327 TaxID=2545265 RepID=UPI0015DDFF2D|nr:NADP-dependent oxidoreductase [Streptomyces sp. AJS327]MBA0050981.1 NADP-dependent oxidoreductase [Streptomyces sp. AJS327]
MTALPTTGRAWHLVSRPHGTPGPDDFALRASPVTEPAEGHVLVRNHYFSVDPYMRGRMGDTPGYAYFPAYPLGEPLPGHAVGEVLASRAPGLAPGDPVLHFAGWREYAEVPAAEATPLDTDGIPLTAYLSALGMTGLSAYAGLFEIAGFRKGDTVFVSGAAGAVGSQAGQLARLNGARRVVGSAGTDEKVRVLVEEFGFDAAFNYRAGPVDQQLREAAPDGIDLYFDTVGGDHLEAAIGALHEHGRVALCGAIAQYNDVEAPPGPRNLAQAIGKRLSLRGMIVTDHQNLLPRFLEEVAPLVRSGELTWRETVTEGIERAPETFLGLFTGDNTGKALVRLDPQAPAR